MARLLFFFALQNLKFQIPKDKVFFMQSTRLLTLYSSVFTLSFKALGFKNLKLSVKALKYFITSRIITNTPKLKRFKLVLVGS